MKVKICGQTSLHDCEISIAHGADYLGVVVGVEWSARSQSVETALPMFDKFRKNTFLLTFNHNVDGKYIDMLEQLNPYAIQLTGAETPSIIERTRRKTSRPIFKSIHLKAEGSKEGLGYGNPVRAIKAMSDYLSAGVDGFVLDTAIKGMYGGTGVKNDWGIAETIIAAFDEPIFIAGGIDPSNAREASVIPGIYGIDLASGVEKKEKGVKSEKKITSLFNAIKNTL